MSTPRTWWTVCGTWRDLRWEIGTTWHHCYSTTHVRWRKWWVFLNWHCVRCSSYLLCVVWIITQFSHSVPFSLSLGCQVWWMRRRQLSLMWWCVPWDRQHRQHRLLGGVRARRWTHTKYTQGHLCCFFSISHPKNCLFFYFIFLNKVSSQGLTISKAFIIIWFKQSFHPVTQA